MNVLPLYLPQQGCKHTCLYCNQPLIVGTRDERGEWKARLQSLQMSPREGEWEIAFYGGAFSAQTRQEMDACFAAVSAFLPDRRIKGIRISTRPDAVSDGVLIYLREQGVRTIELGVESLDDEVLRQSGRGHTADAVRDACARIHHYDFQLGLHLMCGLPGQSATSWQKTVRESVSMRPAMLRIAPTLVLKNTPLERLYRQGRYIPLPLEEAISQCAYAYAWFHRNGIAVARVGLALSDGNGDGADKVVAGPWHPSLRQEVESRLAGDVILSRLQQTHAVLLTVHPKDYSVVLGCGQRNLSLWETKTGRSILIERDPEQPRHTVRVGAGEPLPLFYDNHE